MPCQRKKLLCWNFWSLILISTPISKQVSFQMKSPRSDQSSLPISTHVLFAVISFCGFYLCRRSPCKTVSCYATLVPCCCHIRRELLLPNCVSVWRPNSRGAMVARVGRVGGVAGRGALLRKAWNSPGWQMKSVHSSKAAPYRQPVEQSQPLNGG